MARATVLPDPDFGITDDGNYSSNAADKGPGFASVKVESVQPVMRDRTNSGQLIQRFQSYQKWAINITYNPMTKEEFSPVYAFLLDRQLTMEPFFVRLPQHDGNTTEIHEAAAAGSRQLRIATNSNIKPGDLFYVKDPNDTTHEKAYKVVRHEQQNDLYDDTTHNTAGSPTQHYDRITIVPPLQKAVSITGGNTFAEFADPIVKVIQTTNNFSYSLNKNGLYSFTLKLEEACF